MKTFKLILFPFSFSCLIFFTACKKQVRNEYQVPQKDSAHISITNASPAIGDLYVYLNNKFVSLPDSPVTYGKTVFVSHIENQTTYFPDTVSLPYINIAPGYQELSFRSASNPDIIGFVNDNFAAGGSYSLFLTDTIVHGKVTAVLLKDNIAAADTGKSQIRFLNLSADTPPLDVWAYPNAGYTAYKLFSGCAYIPHDYHSFASGESFTKIDAGIYYFEAAIAGTSNVVLGGYLIIAPKKVITIYTKGYLSGTGTRALDVGVIQY